MRTQATAAARNLRRVCVPRGEFVEVGPEGTVNLIEICYYASPDPLTGETRETPYGTVHVPARRLQGTETFWHFLKKEDLFDVHKGDRVRPVWSDTPRRARFRHPILRKSPVSPEEMTP